MTYKSLTIPAILLITGAFVAGACTLGTIDDEGFGGLGGEGGDASASGGASTGGTAATGGAGGAGGAPADPFCQADGTTDGQLATTDAEQGDDTCQTCRKAVCGDLFAVCYADDWDTACANGSTSYNSMEIPGELDCLASCMQDEGAYDADSIDDCATLCGSSECDPDSAGFVAVDLLKCTVIGSGGDDCFDECY